MRALRRHRRWQLAALTLMSLGSLTLIGCDGLQTGALPGASTAAKPALKLTILGDFAPLRTASTDSRFGRIEIRGGDKLPPRVLKRADLAAALKGTKPLEGVSITNSELVVTFEELEPGDYSLAVVLYDQVEGGTKLSDNTFAKTLEPGVLEAVRLDMAAAVAATAPTPAPTPTPTPPPTQGGLDAQVTLVGNGDGVAHPETLTGTLVEHFALPTTVNSRWVYSATQSIFLNATDHYTDQATQTIRVTGATLPIEFSEEGVGVLGTYGSLDSSVLAQRLRNFGTLGGARLQRTGSTRSFTVSGTSYVGTHYLLTTARYPDEDAAPNWPAPVSTHTYDLWYAPSVGLLESQDTVYLVDGRVMAGRHLRLRTFQRGQ